MTTQQDFDALERDILFIEEEMERVQREIDDKEHDLDLLDEALTAKKQHYEQMLQETHHEQHHH